MGKTVFPPFLCPSEASLALASRASPFLPLSGQPYLSLCGVPVCVRSGVPRGSSPSRLSPTFGLSAGAGGEKTLPLRVFYFKYLMIGPGRADSIFSLYHVWSANHGFWRLGGWEPRNRGRHGMAGEPVSLL